MRPDQHDALRRVAAEGLVSRHLGGMLFATTRLAQTPYHADTRGLEVAFDDARLSWMGCAGQWDTVRPAAVP